jgi:polyisoprenoid-binding protein YceI
MREPAAACLLVFAAAGACAASVPFAIDPSHTFVTFEVSHLGTSTLRGRFDRKQGSVTLDKAARTGAAEITIDMGSVDTGVATLDAQLRGKDFLDVAQFGNAVFKADSFGFDGDKVSEVGGSLTMLGKTRPVTLKATNFNCYINPMLRRETCGGDFETTIARSTYGMTFGLGQGLPDDVHLLVQIEAIKQDAP